MQDRQRQIRLGERRTEQRICRTDEKVAVFESPPNKPRNVRLGGRGGRFCFPLLPPGKKFAPCPAQTLHRPFIIL